jgi:Protein of unknown function (DUF3987)
MKDPRAGNWFEVGARVMNHSPLQGREQQMLHSSPKDPAQAFEHYGKEARRDWVAYLRDVYCLEFLDSFADEKMWVAWREEKRGDRLTKVPKNPATGGNARVPTDPKTYGTRAEAEARSLKLESTTALSGFGIVLGKLRDGRYLAGIDLDSCRDGSGIAGWAEAVIARLDTYTEVSPSGTGVKLFFFLSADDMRELLALLGNNVEGKQLTRKTFAAGEHREVAIDTARFYAVTGQQVTPKALRLVPFADVAWFVDVVGPDYLAQQKSGNGKTDFEVYGDEHHREGDESGSGYGFRFMQDRHAEGMSYEQAREAILTDENEAGEWANRVDQRQLERAWKRSEPLAAEVVKPAEVVPVDLWNRPKVPPLPTGLLPTTIEDYARRQGELMGADPAGLAMGALTICAAAIPDRVQLQVKRHDKGWKESARMWTGLIGPVSSMKSPVMREVGRPLFRIDVELKRAYNAAKATYEEMTKEEKKSAGRPRHTRIRIEDVTPEAAQEILADSPDGVLCFRDELSGWFGSIDKYSSPRGGGMDRGFWLQAYNGAPYVFDRVSRGSGLIENLSINVLGGIQPDAARRVVAEGVDDGLIQRLIPVMLQTATEGRDEVSSHSEKYDSLVGQLHSSIAPQFFGELQFDDDALVIRQQLERKHLELMNLETINKKLGAHIGKYNGMFARMCLLWHVIENYKNLWPGDVSAQTAQRVADFLHRFLLPHAVAFYNDMLGLSDDHDRLMAVVGYILAHKLEKMTSRDVQRGDRTMRGLERRDIERIFDQLEALGWVWRERRRSDSLFAVINPEVHRRFRDHAEREAARRQRERALIARLLGKQEQETE